MPKRISKAKSSVLKIPGAKPRPKPPRLSPSDQYLHATRTYCRVRNYPDPVGEHRFHPVRKWMFDLAWPDHKLAVEVEGGVWTGGRHSGGVGMVKDMEKYNHATAAGWKLYRVTPGQLADGVLWGWLDGEFGRGIQ